MLTCHSNVPQSCRETAQDSTELVAFGAGWPPRKKASL